MTLPKLNNIPSLKPSIPSPDQDTPIKLSSTKFNKWYTNNSHSDDDLATPQKDLSFDIISSTPLINNDSISFSSPIKKLTNLHLNDQNQFEKFEIYNDDMINEKFNDKFDNSIGKINADDMNNDRPESREDEEEEEDEDEYDDQFDDYYLHNGDKTILEEEEDSDNGHNLFNTPPVFVRKRHLPDISDEMDISTGNISTFSMKSNYSDSTPCPPKAKRTKLNFKNDGNLLNLSNSKRLNLENLEKIDDSIPISQSTPANSRAPSPPNKLPANTSHSSMNSNFTPTNTNTPSSSTNYSFVSKYNYTTPMNNPTEQNSMKQAYNQGNFNFDKYEIVGEFPVTSAGLMDESDENVHIGDKRIQDVYSADKSALLLKQAYFDTYTLPILPPNFDIQMNLLPSQLLKLINRQNLLEFYRLINGPNPNPNSLKDLIKLERIKWHPDKWLHKFQNSQEFWFNMEIIHNLSQLLNNLMEEFDN